MLKDKKKKKGLFGAISLFSIDYARRIFTMEFKTVSKREKEFGGGGGNFRNSSVNIQGTTFEPIQWSTASSWERW